ncbi:MAG: L,D-transpeptidase family protein [Pseudomonadota bacterium]
MMSIFGHSVPRVLRQKACPALMAAALCSMPVAASANNEGTKAARIGITGEGGITYAAPEATRSARAMPGLDTMLASGDATDRRLEWFYEARGYEPVWSKGKGVISPAGARALIAAIEGVEAHALAPRRYDIAGLQAALKRPWDAAAEREYTRAYLKLARDLGSGVLEPRRLSRNIDVEPARPDPDELLARLGATREIDRLLTGLAPQTADYQALVAEYARLTALADEPDVWGPQVAKGATLRIGERSARVVALRARLRVMGDYASDAVTADEATVVAAADVTADVPIDTGGPDDRRFDEALETAVKRFQARHGLNEDGVVGPATLDALNTPPSVRARQLAVNLERARWNNGRMRGARIVTNLPDYKVRVYRADETVRYESRVVIGKYRHQTVEFSHEMDHMVVNPTWFVPNSIAVNEILPKLQEDPGYLASKNMRLVGADAEMIEWEFVTPATFPGRVRQRPGPGNALGKVKFMFPNRHAIYLHDTPQKRLFKRDHRAYSHGCVRVETPDEFAKVLLEGQVDDPAASFEAWVKRGRERYVELDRKLPVHLIYRTAWRDGQGTVQFRRDVYRRDALVADALEKLGARLPQG